MSMASRGSFSDDSKMIKKPLPKSLLLRDYLRDDMSSCSSNGFRSYPRRQCFTTVRFLVEMDLNKNGGGVPPKQHPRSKIERRTNRKSNLKPKQSSVLQRASAVMITAIRRFPFAGGTGSPRKASFLPRSISRKLLKHGFWKKTNHHNIEVKRLKSFGDLLKEEEITRPPSPSHFSTAIIATSMPQLTSSTSNSDSWSGSDFTATTDSFTTGDSLEVNLAQNDVAHDSPVKTTNGKGVGATTATATATNYSDTTENPKKWQAKHDEQFSPVSVMDFPSDNDYDNDDEDAVSSEFQYKQLDIEGTKKIMQKKRRFDSVPQLEPVKLEDRIAQLALESSTITSLELVQEDNQVEKKALALVQLMKLTISSHRVLKYEVDESLLLEFFIEQITEENVSDYEMLQVAKGWMDGKQEMMFLEWESENNRQTCLEEMEKGVKWSKYDYELERDDVCLEVEFEIYNSLVDDVLLDFQL